MDEPVWRRLRDVPLFASLSADRLRALWAASVPRRYGTGETLRTAGTPARHLLIMLDGRVAATVPLADGRVVRVGAWTGPCALDKVAVLDGSAAGAALTALAPCRVRALPRAAFLSVLDDSATARGHVLRTLAAQAGALQRRLAEVVTLSTEARLAAWLLDAQDSAGRAPLPGTQQDLADHLGVTRVTVNRALSRLRALGLVRLDGKGTVQILAPDLLALRVTPPG